jgi:uncharacterized peroxidase-related enzyme
VAIKEDYRNADLAPPDVAMLEYADKITFHPTDVTEADIKNLQIHGFNDQQILEIAAVTSLFNYLTRMANALGVETDKEDFTGDPQILAKLSEGLK